VRQSTNDEPSVPTFITYGTAASMELWCRSMMIESRMLT